MTRVCWWLAEKLSRLLEPDERDAALGDFAESGIAGGSALIEVLGLIARRQAALWNDWRPWVALAGVVAPLGMLLSLVLGSISSRSFIGGNYWTAPSRSRLGRLCEQTTSGLDREPCNPSGKAFLNTRTFVSKH